MATKNTEPITVVANLNDDNIESIIEEQKKLLPDRKEELNILVMGRSGAGKSTLINMMFGVSSFEEQVGAKSCTAYKMKKCAVIVGTIKVNIYDTAGLCDDDTPVKSIVKEIRKEFKAIPLHLVLVCIKFGDRVKDRNLLSLLRLLPQLFTGAIWQNCLFVITFSNMHPKKWSKNDGDGAWLFQNMIDEYKNGIKEQLIKHLNFDEANVPDIAVVPAGYSKEEDSDMPQGDSKDLPGIEDWILNLWKYCLITCTPEGTVTLLRVGREREVALQIATVTAGTAIGAVVGGAITTILIPIPVFGTSVGVCTGALVFGVASTTIASGGRYYIEKKILKK